MTVNSKLGPYQDILHEKKYGAVHIPSLPDMLDSLSVGAMEDFITESGDITCCVERHALDEWIIVTVSDYDTIYYDDICTWKIMLSGDEPQALIKNTDIESVSALIASILRENLSCLKAWATENQTHGVCYVNP